MTTNLYDVAYELEKAIRQSNEYETLQKLYDQVNSDATAKPLFDEFRDLQMNIQQKQMSGAEITQEEMEHAQQQVALVQQHELIAQLMAAEQRMSMVIGELNRIIITPLDDLYGPMQP